MLAGRAGEAEAVYRSLGPVAAWRVPPHVLLAAAVAAGLTNREIAMRLQLSARTAQNHVQHILDKLGLTNRSQIAVWVSRRA